MGLCCGKSSGDAYAPAGNLPDKSAKGADDGGFSNLTNSVDDGPDGGVDPDSFGAVLRPMEFGDGTTAVDINHALLVYDNPGRLKSAYRLNDQLGAGSFGSVQKAVKELTGGVRAVKSIDKKLGKHISINAFRQEISIMKMMDHPNIVKLFETFEDSEQIHLVMELCKGSDLRNRLGQVRTFSEPQVALIMQQIFRAVYYIHRHEIVHRDLKTENFMLLTDGPIEDNTVKLIDFGLSRHLPKGRLASTLCGTSLYMSPQVLSGSYDASCDLWSAGVIMYFLLRHYHPFEGKTDAEVMAYIKKGNYSTSGPGWEQSSELCKDLIRMLLRYKPHERFSAENSSKHEFIQQNSRRIAGMRFKPSLIAQFRRFCSHNRLKRGALHVIAQNLEEEDLKGMRETFTALDMREDGILTGDEFEQGLSLALECVDNGRITAEEMEEHLPDLRQLVTELGDSGTTGIGYTEFLAATLEQKHYVNDAACLLAFTVFDRNSDGEITTDELRDVFGEYDYSRVNSLVNEMDANFDGVIDFAEFKQMMQGEPIQRGAEKTVWQVKLNGWADYSKEHQCTLHAASRAGQTSVTLIVAGNNVEVDLKKLVQINAGTGTAREVRERQKYTVWQVQFASWTDCPPYQQELFNAAKQSGQTALDFTANGTTYQADLSALVQRNGRTGYERALRLA